MSERPLYEGKRPGTEPIDGYLDFLKRRLAGTRPDDPIRIGYRVIQTESR
jgi:hypothetical protein